MRKAQATVEKVPAKRLDKSPPCGELAPCGEVIFGIHVPRGGDEHRRDRGGKDAQGEQDQAFAPTHHGTKYNA